MSTPSKRRRQAREWMQAEAQRRAEVRAEGLREGARRMHLDMTTLYARGDRALDHRDDRGIHLTSVIDKFPSPAANGPVLHYVLPTPPTFARRYAMSERVQTVLFQAVEYAVTQKGPGGSATLRWFNWEPPLHIPDFGNVRRVMLRGRSKLDRAAKLLEFLVGSHHHGAFYAAEARTLLREATDELDRRVGEFRPERVA